MKTTLLTLLMLVAPSAAGAQSTCPPDAEGSRALIDGYMSAESFSQHRDSIGMAGLTPFHARVLTDATDLPACQRFVSQFGAFGSHPHWYWSAYKVGTFYVLAWRYVNAGGGFGIGLTPWIILDQNFAQVGGFAT